MPNTPTARPRGGPKPRVAYTPDLATAICRRIHAGDSLKAIGRDPAFPPYSTIAYWRRVHPEFAAALADALDLAGPAPSGPISRYSHDLAREICDRLLAGETVRGLCAQPGMPAATTLNAWLRRHPEFGVLYARMREVEGEMIVDDVCEIAGAITPATADRDDRRIRGLMLKHGRIAMRGYLPERPRVVTRVVNYGDLEPDD